LTPFEKNQNDDLNDFTTDALYTILKYHSLISFGELMVFAHSLVLTNFPPERSGSQRIIVIGNESEQRGVGGGLQLCSVVVGRWGEHNICPTAIVCGIDRAKQSVVSPGGLRGARNVVQ
jgi:hypothetical protein